MWFKQLKLFQLSAPFPYQPEKLAHKLEPLIFTPCPPSFAYGFGFVSPIDIEDAPLVHTANQRFMLICMQLEEKILPATVITQTLNEKVKQLEAQHGKKIRHKEKQALKDELRHTLLSRAFSKLSRIYAYIDTQHNWLIVNTLTESKLEKLCLLLRKALAPIDIHPIDTQKIAPILTQWLVNRNSPNALSIERSCLLSDPNQANRLIRCQQQDLNAKAIQALIQDGCHVNQLAMNWQDNVTFTLSHDFTLRSIRYTDEVTDLLKTHTIESIQQEFDETFFIMTETLSPLLETLVNHLQAPEQSDAPKLSISSNTNEKANLDIQAIVRA